MAFYFCLNVWDLFRPVHSFAHLYLMMKENRLLKLEHLISMYTSSLFWDACKSETPLDQISSSQDFLRSPFQNLKWMPSHYQKFLLEAWFPGLQEALNIIYFCQKVSCLKLTHFRWTSRSLYTFHCLELWIQVSDYLSYPSFYGVSGIHRPAFWSKHGKLHQLG